MTVIALIADFVRSRAIHNRMEFQQRLKALFKRINRESASHILSPYTITLGDEFQAVYGTPQGIFRDLGIILEEVYPEKVRFALGISNLTTAINSDAALGMDGPAFYLAREGLQSLKKTHKSIIQFYGERQKQWELINNTLKLLAAYMGNWKINSIRILNYLSSAYTMDEMETLLRISKRGIYKNIRVNSQREILALQHSILAHLQQEFEST